MSRALCGSAPAALSAKINVASTALAAASAALRSAAAIHPLFLSFSISLLVPLVVPPMLRTGETRSGVEDTPRIVSAGRRSRV